MLLQALTHHSQSHPAVRGGGRDVQHLRPALPRIRDHAAASRHHGAAPLPHADTPTGQAR